MASTRVFAWCVCVMLVSCLKMKGLQAQLMCPVPSVGQTGKLTFHLDTAQAAIECPGSSHVLFEFIAKGSTSGNRVKCPIAAYPPANGSCDAANTCGGCVEQGAHYYVYQYTFQMVKTIEGGKFTVTMCPEAIKTCEVITFATPAPATETPAPTPETHVNSGVAATPAPATETPAPTPETPVNSGSSKACGSLCIGVIVGVVVYSRTDWSSV